MSRLEIPLKRSSRRMAGRERFGRQLIDLITAWWEIPEYTF
jgi:hypothetical protein